MMQEIGTVLVPGLVAGSAYALFALGLSISYGVARVLNFAYGSLFMGAAYLGFVLTGEVLAIPLPLAALAIIVVMYAAGVLIEGTIVRPLRAQKNWKSSTMMATLGLAFVLDNAYLIIFGAAQKHVKPVAEGSIDVLGIAVNYQDVFVVCISIIAVALLELFLRYSKTGKAMRAVSQDMVGANIVGIDVNHVFSIAFGLSMALAGLAAILLAPLTLISPFGGWSLFLKVFVIVVFGGLGSTQGALIGAMIMGLVEAFVAVQFGPSYVMPMWLLILLTVLMFRPKGLFGVWAD